MQSGEALLVDKLARLGVEDPYSAARSEITEDIPQVAKARLERLVRTNLLDRRGSMDIWWDNLQRERDRLPESRAAVVAEVVAKCLDAGITLEDLGVIVEDVASDTAQGFAYLLGDDWDDELGYSSDLPSWVLCEVSPDDDGAQLTGGRWGHCMSSWDRRRDGASLRTPSIRHVRETPGSRQGAVRRCGGFVVTTAGIRAERGLGVGRELVSGVVVDEGMV